MRTDKEGSTGPREGGPSVEEGRSLEDIKLLLSEAHDQTLEWNLPGIELDHLVRKREEEWPGERGGGARGRGGARRERGGARGRGKLCVQRKKEQREISQQTVVYMLQRIEGRATCKNVLEV